jgi:dihydroorotate dehydrogenase
MAKVAAALAEASGIMGLELLPLTDDRDEAVRMVKSVTRQADVPVWVKPRLEVAEAWARPLADAGAHALVIGQPPRGRLAAGPKPPWHALGTLPGTPVDGALYGPLTFGLMLPVLAAVAKLALPTALIACGGIHTPEQMAQALEAGADAVQIDSAVWVEPGLPLWLVGAWLSRSSQAAR